ncbi:MAG: tetratricopeptide repeat protein [Blastocatellales bacterium]
MKYSFLGSNITIVLVSVILGLFIGFKISNSQYRAEQGVTLQRQVAMAAEGSPLSADQKDQIEKNFRDAINKAKSNPQDVEAQLDAADQFIQVGNGKEAMPYLELANKAKPDDARVAAGLGMANFMMGNYDQAITWSKKSIGLNPQNPGASFLLVASYIRSNTNLDEAEKLIAKLESEGIEKGMIDRAREELKAARAGKSAQQPAQDGKTMLQHGPENK